MARRQFLTILISLLFFLSAGMAGAQVIFNPGKANKALDKMSIELSVVDVDLAQLRAVMSGLVAQKNQARSCAKKADEELEVLAVQMNELALSDADPKKTSDAEKFLNDKKLRLVKRRAACRLFMLRASEAIGAFEKATRSLATTKLFAVSPSVWENILNLPKQIKASKSIFDGSKFISQVGIDKITRNVWIGFAAFMLLAFGVGFKLRATLKAGVKIESSKFFRVKLQQAACLIFSKNIFFLCLLFFAAIYFSILAVTIDLPTYLLEVCVAFIAFIFVRFLIQFLVSPPKQVDEVRLVPETLSKPLAFRLKLLLYFILVDLLLYLSFSNQGFPEAMVLLFRTGFMTLLSIVLMSIVWLINSSLLLSEHKIWRWSLNLVFGVALLGIIAIEWVGYHRLADYIILGFSKSIALTLAALAIHKIIMTGLSSISGSNYAWQQNIRYYLGLKKNAGIPEIIWLQLGFFAIIWGGYGMLLLDIWGYSQSSLSYIRDGIMNGVTLTGITLIPARIVWAFFAFAVLATFTRWLRTRIGRRTSSSLGGRGVHNSLAAIIGYIGFSFAIIFALLVAGVNFAGLALIAGALSVGIGFGLQNIVNNFVSGIVLLVERPIRVGDRIIVGEVEGHVRKISIRSTVVRTRNRTDVIIPNADLIAGQVDNLMFGDTIKRLQIYVGVAYGSDVELVKKTLLEVAEAHPDVVNDDDIKPLALFNEFADSALLFELRIVIRNVDRQQHVRSEIHFAIDKAFRAENIEIAFPQTDIHIRSWPQQGPLLDDPGAS